jgi:uncharacterized protein YqjF (DUF2071 family)
MMSSEANIDRLSIRARPGGLHLMRQTWAKLLFMHWRLPAAVLRARVPAQLEIDTFDDEAWIGVVPFTIRDMRASFLPPVPGLSEMHELNVRTYVRHRGVPGIYFFSLDASSALAVFGARTFFLVPYFTADLSLRQQGDSITYRSRRTHRGAPAARFDARWTFGARLPESQPGSLEFFLTERYCFYTTRGASVFRCRIHHAPWPLSSAEVSTYHSTMIESHGLPAPEGPPLLHYAEAVTADIWPLERM